MKKTAHRPRQPIRFRGRSFMALVLAPEAPLDGWLQELDVLLHRSPGFFSGRAVILDVSALSMEKSELAALIAELNQRDIRITGVEGADPSWLSLGLPPAISRGRPAGEIEVPENGAPATSPAPAGPPQTVSSLLLDTPVRSGQSIIYPEGDVIVLGSVASGAEIVAGGSIHVYGALRGRAIAGMAGNTRARIFCRKLEAELMAIDGLYKTADDMDSHLRGRPVQAWLEGDAIKTAILD